MTPKALRRAAGIVAHALSTPVGQVLDMRMSEFSEWLEVAQEIMAVAAGGRLA